jgi:hypothetical protein
VLVVLLGSVAAYYATVRAERQAEAMRPRVPSMMVDPDEVLRRSRQIPELPMPQFSAGQGMPLEGAAPSAPDSAAAAEARKKHDAFAKRMQQHMAEMQRILKENPPDARKRMDAEMRKTPEGMR